MKSANFVKLLVQGRVLTKHVIDGLTIKMFFNPHIVEFWQVSSD